MCVCMCVCSLLPSKHVAHVFKGGWRRGVWHEGLQLGWVVKGVVKDDSVPDAAGGAQGREVRRAQARQAGSERTGMRVCTCMCGQDVAHSSRCSCPDPAAAWVRPRPATAARPAARTSHLQPSGKHPDPTTSNVTEKPAPKPLTVCSAWASLGHPLAPRSWPPAPPAPQTPGQTGCASHPGCSGLSPA